MIPDATSLPGDQGAVYMAVVPYAAEPPFRLTQPDGSEHTYENARDLAIAVRRQEEPIDFSITVQAKIRPVLLLQDRPLARFHEYAALQITSLANLPSQVAQRVRNQEESSLFHLDARRTRYGLRNESVIDLQSLMRVRKAGLVGKKLGSVDESEFRTICERLVAVTDLDLNNLIVREASKLIGRLRGRSSLSP